MEPKMPKLHLPDVNQIQGEITHLKQQSRISLSEEAARYLLSVIDLTTLDVRDTEKKVAFLCSKVNKIPDLFGIKQNVAGICVYPRFIPTVKRELFAEGVKIVSVAGGFPSGQTPLSVKIQETLFAMEHGAEEIDMVIPVGLIVEKQYNQVIEEIAEIKKACGPDIHVKVILESGIYENKKDLQQASICAMMGGADFIKTSTGKTQPAARPEDVWIMADTIKAYYGMSGRRVGIKAAGGISRPEDALLYKSIVHQVLGEAWTSPEGFRIGASRLANAVLSMIQKDSNTYF